MPTFIQEAETAWGSLTSPSVTASFSALAGDVLVACSLTTDCQTGSAPVAISNNGVGLAWDLKDAVTVVSFCQALVWTTTLTEDRSGLTVSFTLDPADVGLMWIGGTALTFRSAQVGVSNKANFSTGAPTLGLTTTSANSAIVVANSDWLGVSGASRTWRTGAGALTEITYFTSASTTTVYIGYHANAGAAAAQTVGLSAPTGQKYSIVAVEVKDFAEPPLPEQTDLITLTAAQ